MPTLQQLLADLAVAVGAGDRARACDHGFSSGLRHELRCGEGACDRPQHGKPRLAACPATHRRQCRNAGQGEVWPDLPRCAGRDRDLFLDLARLYSEYSERTTLYASDGDLPVHLSAKLHDARRAGYFAPYTVTPGVPDFDIDLLGHNYFAQAEALLHDMFDLMRLDAAPGKPQRIMPGTDGSVSFWKLRR